MDKNEAYKTELFADFPDVVTPEDLRVMLRGSNGNSMGAKKVYSLLKQGTVESFKIGREYRIFKSSVIDYLHRLAQC